MKGQPTPKLYEPCAVCEGTGRVDPAKFRGFHSLLSRAPLDAAGRVECPCCEGLRFVETGLTVGQVEKIVDENRRLKARVRPDG